MSDLLRASAVIAELGRLDAFSGRDVHRLAARLVAACRDVDDRFDRAAAALGVGWADGYNTGVPTGHAAAVRHVTQTAVEQATSARLNRDPDGIEAVRYLHAAAVEPEHLRDFLRATRLPAPPAVPTNPQARGYAEAVLHVVTSLAAELGQGVAVTLDQVRPLPGTGPQRAGEYRLLAATHQVARAAAAASSTVTDPGPSRRLLTGAESGVGTTAADIAALAAAGVHAGHSNGSVDAAASAARRIVADVADRFGHDRLQSLTVGGSTGHQWLAGLSTGAVAAAREAARSPAVHRPAAPPSTGSSPGPAAQAYQRLTVTRGALPVAGSGPVSADARQAGRAVTSSPGASR